jgi:hypothetical protein
MRRIPLHGKNGDGSFALIDDDDFDAVGGLVWRRLPSQGGGYVTRKDRGRNVYLHRVLTGAPTGLCVDHIDGDVLNNQRANLRICTVAENVRNRRVTPGRALPKGVSFQDGGYRARIHVGNREIHLGRFQDATEAGRAYDAAARHHHGEFARTNAPA